MAPAQRLALPRRPPPAGRLAGLAGQPALRLRAFGCLSPKSTVARASWRADGHGLGEPRRDSRALPIAAPIDERMTIGTVLPAGARAASSRPSISGI